MSVPAAGELEFRYHGFARILRRYRTATITGWMVVLAGVAGLPLGWRAAGSHGLLDLALCAGAVLAGLVLVSESVSFLHAYLSVPYPSAADAEPAPVLEELRVLMKDVDDGGWQDAYAAIARLQALGRRHGLPAPGSTPESTSPASLS